MAGAWRWPPTPFSAEVKERVELYIYSPVWASWPVIGWTLYFVSLESDLSSSCSTLSIKTFTTFPRFSIFWYLHAVECVWNVTAHAQKPDFVFRRNGRVHLNRLGCQFSRLLAAEVCASALVMLGTPRSEVVWGYWLSTPLTSFPFTSPPVRHRVPPGFKRTLQQCSVLPHCDVVVVSFVFTVCGRFTILHTPNAGCVSFFLQSYGMSPGQMLYDFHNLRLF